MRHTLLTAVLVGLSCFIYAQDVNHYVVVGAFGDMNNAVRLSNKVPKAAGKAQHDINNSKGLHYVYVFRSANLDQAQAYLSRIRVETPYKDAWIFHGRLGNEPVVTAAPTRQPEVKKEEPAPVEPEKTVVEEPAPVVTPTVAKSDPVLPKPVGKPFFFKLVSEETGNPVPGEIQVLESAKATEYLAFESNKLVYLPTPKAKNGTFMVKTLSPGYKQLKRSISYTDPGNSAASKGASDEFIIALPLVRVKAGDYIEFTSVRFYQNSAVLQPESRGELGGLAALMKEKESYKVVIHGHCNGDESRDITSPAANEDLFTTGTTNVRETADAKKFTLLRAETVKAYLVQEGIDPARIKTKGEGGKDYIYPKNSTLSARNDRVEVEIKKGK